MNKKLYTAWVDFLTEKMEENIFDWVSEFDQSGWGEDDNLHISEEVLNDMKLVHARVWRVAFGEKVKKELKENE